MTSSSSSLLTSLKFYITLGTLLVTMGIMVLSGVVICALSTFFVVGRLVGYNRDQLYAY